MATPLDELKSRVSGLKAEVSRMLQEPASATPTGPTAWDVFAEEAGAAIGGVLTSDFFGRTRIGSSAGRARWPSLPGSAPRSKARASIWMNAFGVASWGSSRKRRTLIAQTRFCA